MVTEIGNGVFEDGADWHFGSQGERAEYVCVVWNQRAVPDYRCGSRIQTQVSVQEAWQLCAEDLTQVFEHFLQVESSGERISVVAWHEAHVFQRGVANDEISAHDIEVQSADFEAEDGGIGKSDVAEEVVAVG